MSTNLSQKLINVRTWTTESPVYLYLDAFVNVFCISLYLHLYMSSWIDIIIIMVVSI